MTAPPRPIDALVFEIGSTTTVVSAFDGLTAAGDASGETGPRLLGQGFAPTSVVLGDVAIGLDAAREALEATLGPLAPGITLATSSAAGGLRMTVHGLTERMTAMAAREAALGAGAVVKFQTAGRLRDTDIARIAELSPNLILLAGGVEGGDCETILFNARRLEELPCRPIVVYAGNSAVCDETRELLEAAGFRARITRNVYPAVDKLDVVPARAAIHDAFEEHIIHAPGMERIGEIVTGRILPTPGAVLIAAELLAEAVGDLVVVDVGGATTDVHSVTDGSPEIAAMSIEPQPHSKRTVEGDLGTFVSAAHVAEMMDPALRPAVLPPALPQTDVEIAAAAALTRFCAVSAMQRHAGQLEHLYTPTGRQTVATGRDLTSCRVIVGTGGALTRLPDGVETLQLTRGREGAARLLPPADALCVLDAEYLMACCGSLSTHFSSDVVVNLLRHSTGL